MRSALTRFRVRYAETDGQRIAHHAAYPVWFEMGRADLLRDLGLDYNAMERNGAFMVVAELHVRYRKPVRYDEELLLETTTGEVGRSSVRVVYRLTRDGTEVATGETLMVMVGPEGRPITVPDPLRRALEAPEAAGWQGDAPPPDIA
ncbi:MAG: thioesterase family protein [Candidatus Sericytochromatia bacterium]|nr:thioesterase family protein [Candidatus Sericytochromatia bacterium]